MKQKAYTSFFFYVKLKPKTDYGLFRITHIFCKKMKEYQIKILQ